MLQNCNEASLTSGTERPALTSQQYDVLVAAVTVARDRGVKSLKLLRAALIDLGCAEADINAALETWSQYEASKHQRLAGAA